MDMDMDYETLKLKHLQKSQFKHEEYLRTGSKKDWEYFLDEQWIASCVQYLDLQFFEDRKEIRAVLQKKTEFLIQDEIEYQRDCKLWLFLSERFGIVLDGWGSVEICIGWYQGAIELSQERILNYQRKLKKVNHVDTDCKIDRAKTFPIDTFLKFNKAGFIECLFHDEKTPSMKWYPESNTVHCFGCQKNADVIDVCQKLWGTSFLETVDKLV
jgi:hypothetical protein